MANSNQGRTTRGQRPNSPRSTNDGDLSYQERLSDVLEEIKTVKLNSSGL